jgi:hypothetical protein
MARRVVLDCDVDPSHEATENVAVALNGEAWELDVCDADAKKIRDTIGRLVKPARSMNVRDLVRRPTNGNSSEADPQVVRAWAQAKGIAVADKGRVAEDVVAQWRAAGSPTNW